MSIRKERRIKVGDGVTDWDSITNKPSAFPAMAHPHPMDDVDGLLEWATEVEAKMPHKYSQLEDDIGLMKAGSPISYNTLEDRPTLFSGSYEDLSDVPDMASVALSGDYRDLSNRPAIPTMPTLATVATSGSYNDLSNKPAIPTVNYPVVSVNGKTGSVVLTSSDTGSAPASHTHTIAQVNGLQAALDSKQNAAPTRRQELYSGVTDNQGNYSVAFATPYPSTPNIQVQVVNGNHNHSVRVISVTANGFTISAGLRASLTVLGLSVLGFDVTAAAGIPLDVLVTSKT